MHEALAGSRRNRWGLRQLGLMRWPCGSQEPGPRAEAEEGQRGLWNQDRGLGGRGGQRGLWSTLAGHSPSLPLVLLGLEPDWSWSTLGGEKTQR